MGAADAHALLRDLGILHGHGDGARLELATSGSTATPRTVVRTLASWVDSFSAFTQLTRMAPADTVLIPASPRASSAFAFAAAHAAWLGANAVTLPRWNARDAVAAGCTVAHLTPHMLSAILAQQDLGSLRGIVCAGAALSVATRDRAAKRGLRVIDYYGATELSFVAIRNESRSLVPFPEVEIDIRDNVIWVRSPWLSQGYAAGQTGPMHVDPDGWATVGDHGTVDDHCALTVAGRGDELILCGGASVLPGDVERVMLSANGIADAVVIGLPHPILGEVVAAVVVPSSETEPDLDALRHHAATALAPTHLPRQWLIRRELPLTEAGKVDRAALRAMFAAARTR